MVRLYLASPLGFADSTKAFLVELNTLLQSSGHAVFDPWSQLPHEALESAKRETDYPMRLNKFRQANAHIAGRNEEAIRSCEVVLAVLDGVDVDSGTASEIGFGYGVRKTVYGLRTDRRQTGDNEGAIVNLQVEHWITASGGEIYLSLENLRERLSTGPLTPRN
jgi:nucleoside 2-deoxyribosyltransferase